jgi:hypothetical protein
LVSGEESDTIAITTSPLSYVASEEIKIMAKGNNAQGRDKKKAKAGKKNAKPASKQAAAPRKS